MAYDTFATSSPIWGLSEPDHQLAWFCRSSHLLATLPVKGTRRRR